MSKAPDEGAGGGGARESDMGPVVGVLAQTVAGLQVRVCSAWQPVQCVLSLSLSGSLSLNAQKWFTHKRPRGAAQETMGVAYQRMAGSLQQSLQMMQQMNGAPALMPPCVFVGAFLLVLLLVSGFFLCMQPVKDDAFSCFFFPGGRLYGALHAVRARHLCHTTPAQPRCAVLRGGRPGDDRRRMHRQDCAQKQYQISHG
jgi:hypothetical protein